MKKSPVSLDLRIDWSEMDLFGHVNNVSYFKYIQAARVNYWDYIGLNAYHQTTNIGPMLAATGCQFKQPLFFPGQVHIQTRVTFIKNTSFGLQHQLYNDDEVLVAEAEDVIVLFDFNTDQKVPVSQELRNKIETLEGRAF